MIKKKKIKKKIKKMKKQKIKKKIKKKIQFLKKKNPKFHINSEKVQKDHIKKQFPTE